jgi:integrase
LHSRFFQTGARAAALVLRSIRGQARPAIAYAKLPLLLTAFHGTTDRCERALLLTRATGIRIGECTDLAEDCLRSVGPDQWALHVPLGKLHTERLVPVDPDIRQVVTHILARRQQVPSFHLSRSIGLLVPRSARRTLYRALRGTLKAAAARAGCPPVSCHQLRHTYASEMIRLGVSLPALMQLLGHKISA